MTEDEYKSEKEELLKQHNKELFELASKYALSNNKVKVGDIVISDVYRVKVEKIRVSTSFRAFPECVYYGLALKKNNDPRKDGSKAAISQSCVKEHIAQDIDSDLN